MFTVEELALYNGTDQSLPIFLGILGYPFVISLNLDVCYMVLEVDIIHEMLKFHDKVDFGIAHMIPEYTVTINLVILRY